eukprot:5248-Heterococcus_DN1.PRE.1
MPRGAIWPMHSRASVVRQRASCSQARSTRCSQEPARHMTCPSSASACAAQQHQMTWQQHSSIAIGGSHSCTALLRAHTTRCCNSELVDNSWHAQVLRQFKLLYMSVDYLGFKRPLCSVQLCNCHNYSGAYSTALCSCV